MDVSEVYGMMIARIFEAEALVEKRGETDPRLRWVITLEHNQLTNYFYFSKLVFQLYLKTRTKPSLYSLIILYRVTTIFLAETPLASVLMPN